MPLLFVVCSQRSDKVFGIGVALDKHFDEAVASARELNPELQTLQARLTWDKRWEFAPMPDERHPEPSTRQADTARNP